MSWTDPIEETNNDLALWEKIILSIGAVVSIVGYITLWAAIWPLTAD